MKLKYLITGTGRCGTVYLARLLTSVGIPCGHESVFDCGGWESARMKLNSEVKPALSFCSKSQFNRHSGVWEPVPEWINEDQIVADSSYLAAPFLSRSELNDCWIVHVVRNPIEVISSFVNSLNYFRSSEPRNDYENLIYSCIPDLTKEMPQIDRCALYYVRWNEMIENQRVNFWMRIESGCDKLLELIGAEKSAERFDDKTVNTMGEKDRFVLSMIESEEIRYLVMTFGFQYGYFSSSEYLLL